MPTIRVELMEGRTPEQKKGSDWATAGEPWSDKK